MSQVKIGDESSKQPEGAAFSDMYKYTGRTSSASKEEKRRVFLQIQKEKRCESFDVKRDISDLFEVESMEVENVRSKTSHASKRTILPFSYKFMNADWLTEVPDDFDSNWLFKVCLDGDRFLVVATKAVTTCYVKNGKSRWKFRSNLPGGTPSTGHKFTVLDCIFNKGTNTFFIYDALAWNSMSLIDAEAQMRFAWLKSKFEENPEFSGTSFPHKLFVVDDVPCQKSLMQDRLFSPFVVEKCVLSFQGILFYHKEGHYTFGESPLVCWLRSFMLQEVLDIDVSNIHLEKKPDNYTSMQEFIARKKSKNKRRGAHKVSDIVAVEMEEADLGDGHEEMIS